MFADFAFNIVLLYDITKKLEYLALSQQSLRRSCMRCVSFVEKTLLTSVQGTGSLGELCVCLHACVHTPELTFVTRCSFI